MRVDRIGYAKSFLLCLNNMYAILQSVYITKKRDPVSLQAAMPYLRTVKGCVVNLCDVLGERPGALHITHCISKAGLASATKCLALAAAPHVSDSLIRVNFLQI